MLPINLNIDNHLTLSIFNFLSTLLSTGLPARTPYYVEQCNPKDALFQGQHHRFMVAEATGSAPHFRC